MKAQQTQSKIFLGQTYKNAELQIAANLALRTTDVKYLFRNCLWQKSHNEEKNQTVSVLTFGMIIAVMLYNLALTFPYQVDAINSKSSNIISDILTIIVPDQKIYFAQHKSSYSLSLLRRKSQVEFGVIKTNSFSLNQTLFI